MMKKTRIIIRAIDSEFDAEKTLNIPAGFSEFFHLCKISRGLSNESEISYTATPFAIQKLTQTITSFRWTIKINEAVIIHCFNDTPHHVSRI